MRIARRRNNYTNKTPIGNLKDITLRALDILRDVDLILSEDTRETDKVLKQFEIMTKQISYREQITCAFYRLF